MAVKFIETLLLDIIAGDGIEVFAFNPAFRKIYRSQLGLEDDSVYFFCFRLRFTKSDRSSHIAVVTFVHTTEIECDKLAIREFLRRGTAMRQCAALATGNNCLEGIR